ncbi:GspH/FimT family pseudopilin [Stutzerimonas stutzeri]|uniref:GspH/FimT family pseudopilin n=1 Tax=Stutzerimonas stutzeri TaxID=316 RepID=UPI003C6ECFFF
MRPTRAQGVSLLELLCTLAVIAILLSIAVPAISTFKQEHQVRSVQTDLLKMTYLARYLAMTRQAKVTLCPLTELGACNQQWTQSLSSFIDGNGNRRLDQGEEIVGTLYVPDQITLRWRGMLPANSIHFSTQGVTFVSNGTMSICPQNKSVKAGAMVINRQGRVQLNNNSARCQ